MQRRQTDHPLRQTARPTFESGLRHLRLVDLFAGCGGLTLGLAQAAYELGVGLQVPLAVDFEGVATSVYKANFPAANVATASVEEYFDGELGAQISPKEWDIAVQCGKVDALVGGPPCQGHSNLNNKTRRNDPKNTLYARMARAAEVLRPSFVVVENVPAVLHDKGDVVGVTLRHMEELGYSVASETVPLHGLGVAQTRRRHILLATTIPGIDPGDILTDVARRTVDSSIDLRWAIGDLEHLAAPTGYDVPPLASEANRLRMEYLLQERLYDLPNALRPPCHQNEHSYKSMYGRLSWDLPAQTITSGYGSIGQGRYMHPSQPRALTAHEAARIQGFPDYFDFSRAPKKADLATMIGNAVPPALLKAVAAPLISHLLPALVPASMNAPERGSSLQLAAS